MIRKPNVTMESIKKFHQLKAVNRVIVRKGSEFLQKQQPKTAKKLP
jgi:hypothetical protein